MSFDCAPPPLNQCRERIDRKKEREREAKRARGREVARGEAGGESERQLKAGAHLLRLPCQVKEEKAMNIKPEVCVHHVLCVQERERERARGREKKEQRQKDRSRVEE